jgi:hypothetical protein
VVKRKSDYDTDFYEWTQHQAAALAAGHVSELDLANLAEEIESLGRSDRRELRSRLKVLMMHLLKWSYQPERRRTGRSWWRTIRTQRGDISLILEDSPSLRGQVPDMIEADYRAVRIHASGETGLPLETFPETCPWTAEQVLDEAFWPGEEAD